jgi:hypothetical protein
MTVTITIGAGRLNPLGSRVDVDDLAEVMENLPIEEDGWISGLVWVGDRRLGANWESAGVLFVDADHYIGEGFVHGPTTPEARATLEALSLACSGWHHTPRGFRAWFVLQRNLTDPAEYHRAMESAQRAINDALEAGEILGKKGDRQGYRADAATMDLARWMFRPRCIVDGIVRCAGIHRGIKLIWSVEEVHRLGTGRTTVARELLARMPAAGPGDGSLELIRVCRRALSLGLETFDEFKAATADWNAGRWDDDALRVRWDAAAKRWLGEGRVAIPANEKGKPIYGLDTLEMILVGDRRYRDRLRRNDMDMRVLVGAKPLDDEDVTEVRLDLRKRYGFTTPKDDAHDLIRAVAARASFSPVADWLNGLRWDGASRYREVVERVLGLRGADADLGEVYLRRWSIGAVHRARRPGCKMDNVLLLVGDQGIGKSTFFRGLAGEWFSDTFIDLSNKDGFLQLLGTWVYELSELEAVYRRVDVSRLRGVLSSTEDRFRAPYERSVKSHPRRVVFVGSSNSFDVLQDPDGSRRFWALEALSIDRDRLARCREGLWAEAVVLADKGEPHWLTSSEDTLRCKLNARFERDNPDMMRAQELAKKADKGGCVDIRDVLRAMGYPMGGAPSGVQSQASTGLARLGYRRGEDGLWRVGAGV